MKVALISRRGAGVRVVMACCGLFGVLGGVEAQEGREKSHAQIVAEQRFADHIGHWPRYSLTGIPLVDERPVIDGVVDRREWFVAAKVSHIYLQGTGLAVDDHTAFLINYTPTHLNIAFQFERPQSALEPDARDFFEILLDHNHDHKRCLNFAHGLQEPKWTGLAPNLDRAGWTPGYEFAARATDFGWEGEVSFAFADMPGLSGAPAPGTVWGYDLVRNEKSPYDRLAQVSWRSAWGAVEDLAHLVFLGRPLAVKVDRVGYLPEGGRSGIRLELANFSDQAESLAVQTTIRRAEETPLLPYYKNLASALAEDLSAAKGGSVEAEIAGALQGYRLLEEESVRVELPARGTKIVEHSVENLPGECLIGVTVRTADVEPGALLLGQLVAFEAKLPLAVALTSYAYSAGVVDYVAELRKVRAQIQAGAVLEVALIHDGTGAVVSRDRQEAIAGKTEARGSLRVDPAAGRTYTVRAQVEQDGALLLESQTPLVLPEKAAWIHNDLGKSSFVPPPWTALKASANAVETLNIAYAFDGAQVLPSFTVRGREILTAPPTLILKDGAGQPVPLKVLSVALGAHDLEQAAYRVVADAGALGRITADMTIEFDGFLWCDLQLEPGAGAALGALQLRLPYKKQYAKLYTYARMDAGYFEKFGLAIGRDAGFTPEEIRHYPFLYKYWLGWVDGGLEWYSERPQNWRNADPARAIVMRPEAEATVLEINFVDQPVTLTEATTWSFGLMPTPARTMMQGYEEHSYHQILNVPGLPDETLKATDPEQYEQGQQQYEGFLGRIEEYGVRNVILFGHWNREQWGYPTTHDPALMARLRDFCGAMRARNANVLIFAGWGVTTKAPEWREYGTELIATPLINAGWGSYAADPSSLYPDWYCYNLVRTIREAGVAGVYMDSTSAVKYSEHPNGMRWVDHNGDLRGTYAIRDMRAFTKRIYKILHGEIIENGVYYNHHSPPANPAIENFTDVRCPSEFAQFYDQPLDMDYVGFFIAKNGGVQYGYHSELTNKNWMDTKARTINQLFAVAMPLSVSFKSLKLDPRLARASYDVDAQPMYKIWEAMAWLDSARAEYLPWWENGEYVQVAPETGVLSALWLRRGEKAILCVTNLENESRTLAVTVNGAALGLADLKLEDAITGEAIPVRDGTFTQTIEPERWRLIKIQ
ncbi:MAG: hypothetical protein K9N49_09435 [Candidatus Marinimicrobia bacterium]|nr:hypothetical protein [Candidatus Neomarinimicrobiota bacterium]